MVTPTVAKCPNCDGPLPEATGPSIVCPYCGAAVTLREPAPRPVPDAVAPVRVKADPEAVRRLTLIILLSVAVPIVLSIVIGLVVGGGMCAMCGVAGVAASRAQPATTSSPSAPAWDGRTPLLCTTDQEAVPGLVASFPGATAITATGRCHLTLIDATIVGATAIDASGHAHIELRGGRLEGQPVAVRANG